MKNLEEMQKEMRAQQKRQDRQQRLREKEQKLRERELRLREREKGLEQESSAPEPEPEPEVEEEPQESQEPQGQQRIRRKSLVNQLQDALTDAEALQHQTKRGEDFFSLAKLVSKRISGLERLISRKENSALEELTAQNEKLKQKVITLELEIETLKAQQRPVGLSAAGEPVAPTPDAIAIKQSQDEIATTLERMRRGEGSGLSTDAAMAKQGEPQVASASKLPDISGIPPHVFQPVPLNPPIKPVETLALPRPVIFNAEDERKIIAASLASQFSNADLEESAKRIQDESRKKAEANKSIVAQEVAASLDTQELLRAAQETLERYQQGLRDEQRA